MVSKVNIGLGLLLLVIVIVAAIIPVIIVTTTPKSSKSTTPTTTTTTNVPQVTKKPWTPNVLSDEEKSRINCFLEEESRFEMLTKYQCEEVRSCIYNPSEYERVPNCYFNRQKLGYELKSSFIKNNAEEYRLKKSNLVRAPYLEEIEELKLTVEYLEKNVIHVKIVDSNDPNRYEVPYELNKLSPIDNKDNSKAKFEVNIDQDTNLFHFKIIRKSDNTPIFDTSMGAFVFNNQFLQISTKLPSKYVYGFGENNHESLLHDLNYRSWGMFARDHAPGWGDNRNNYGFQPVYFSMEENQKGHLVLLYNSNAMEYLFTPMPSLTLRTIGGVLDFYFVVDDLPEDVFKTYHKIIGLPLLPPYWSLGFQISRWGYDNLNQVKEVVERTKAINLPQDVQYIDIEYMIGFRIFTLNQLNFSGLSDFQKELKSNGQKLVLIVDPALVMEKNNSNYMTGLNKDIYVKWPQNMAPYDKEALGKNDMISWCWPNGKVVYPDHLNNKTHEWWFETIRDFTSNEINGTDMDGIWIDMNEPSSFETNEIKPWNWLYPQDDQDRYPFFSLKCPTNKLDDPPYRTKNAFAYDDNYLLNPKARLSQKTLCMIAQHKFENNKIYNHYDVHNLYGHSQAIATYKAMKRVKPGKRPYSLTRSNFVGTGKYATHWQGDNDATWKHMKMSIGWAIEYNIFGIPMVGADICGFFISVQDAEMCTRWLQLGAFYTFSRNHNANKQLPKDPASYKNKTLEDSTREVLKIRYEILPYIYTLLYNSHKNGGTAIKALFFEFPNDKETYAIDEQFLLGSLLISPVLYPGKTSVKAYFPNTRWFDLRTGVEYTSKGWQTLNAPISYINVHLRGGAVLPTQELNQCLNTVCSRKNSMGLIISLDENNSSKGNLFWDDGESDLNENAINYFYANFEFNQKKLEMKIIKKFSEMEKSILKTIKFYGYGEDIQEIKLNDQKFESFTQNKETKVVEITNLDLKLNNEFKIELL